MAETLEQWYDMLQETYDKWNDELHKWNDELQDLEMKIKELSLRISEEDNEDNEDNEELQVKVIQLQKKASQITPTLERYKYYLDYRSNPTPVTELLF